jgi:hypothetical protein
MFIILRSRLLTEPRILLREYGTIPVDPSDDAGDEGGISGRVSLNKQATDPKSHTLVRNSYIISLRSRYLLNSDGRPSH